MLRVYVQSTLSFMRALEPDGVTAVSRSAVYHKKINTYTPCLILRVLLLLLARCAGISWHAIACCRYSVAAATAASSGCRLMMTLACGAEIQSIPLVL